MENDTTLSKEGLLESVLPGSVTFDNSILAPLRNSYLYVESKECFTYTSAYVINNAVLKRRYSAFRTEKQENGYSEEELEESIGFLLFDDESRANKLAETGLMVGQGTCTTLGDSSKGVYISKYSDCLDLKRWYDGKTGYIVLLKLTKGRVKEVAENYTQNFTPPSFGFDCHVSEQLGAVCNTTSSFLAFERTQYYIYELLDGGSRREPCPRQVYPFAIVAFSYGKTTSSLELMDKSHEKASFQYQPWSGQLKIDSVVYDIGFKSIHGATFPANIPKTVTVEYAIEISELRKALPQALFETTFVGEASFDSRCYSLYDLVSTEAVNDLSLLTCELKEKDLALVVSLDDGGFLILLHSSHFFSYEGSGTNKASALQGMFIFPDSRTVPRETKRQHISANVSPDILQILPALNYAESEMEKCPTKGKPLDTVEKHLQNFATLILPGLSSSPAREASMFPDQYDVPDGFPLSAPKWTEEADGHLKTYLENPCSFQIPVARALELLAAGKQQRSDDDHDDDVYYYISSPEDAPQTPADITLERVVTDVPDHSVTKNVSDEMKTGKQQPEKQNNVPADLSHSALPEEGDTPGMVVVATSDSTGHSTHLSPKSGDLPEHCAVNVVSESEKTSQGVSDHDDYSGVPEGVSKEAPVESTSESSTEIGNDVLVVADKASLHSKAEAELAAFKKEDCRSDSLSKDSGVLPIVDKDVLKEVALSESPATSENQTELLVEDCTVQPQISSDVIPESKFHLQSLSWSRGKRKMKGFRRNPNKADETPSVQNTNSLSCSSMDSTSEQSDKGEANYSSSQHVQQKDWRSLPRRKKFWHADVTVRRVLRSDVKNSETESIAEKSPVTTEPSVTRNIKASTPKRKMEGINMRERYGLKTIITECGRVFVPHGSEVATGDMMSSKETKDSQDSLIVTTTSPGTEKPTDTSIAPLSQTEKGQHLTPNTLSSQLTIEENTTPHQNTDQSVDSDLKITKTKVNVYKAISISKLKTVLKRAKRTKSPRSSDHTKSITDNAEPAMKKGRQNNDVTMATYGILSLLEDTKENNSNKSPRKDGVGKNSNALQNNYELAGSDEERKNTSSKSLVSWREHQSSSSQEKQMPKENGCLNFDTSAPNEIVKQTDQQLMSALTEDRLGGKRISSESKSINAAPGIGASLPSDGLNLLADLALSVNSEKRLHNPAKSKQETNAGVKTSNLPESVRHALLQCSSTRLKLPPRSPFPESLVVPGDLLLEISKEHSYSQPPSLLSGFSGACPQVLSPAGSVESLLFLNPTLQLKLPVHKSGTIYQEKGEKNGCKRLTSSDAPPPFAMKIKMQRPKFLHQRQIIEKDNSIQVTKFWGEIYDFKFDSRFTNNLLEKSVTRALHGKWDICFEDTYEQVHLVFHMWIGLFYSKPTARFFHFDHSSPLLERKDSSKESDSMISSPLPKVGLRFMEDSSLVQEHPLADVLDLSVKATESADQCRTVSQGSSEEQPTDVSDIRSKWESTVEIRELAFPSSNHTSYPLEPSVMDYRSTLSILEENSISDSDGYSDIENDAVTLSSYTKLLENNSAYSNLCEKTTNMCIDEDKCSGEQNNLLVGQKSVPSELRSKSPEKVSSLTVTSFGPKAVAVYHKVPGPSQKMNVTLSKMNDQFPERNTFNSMSFKSKTGNEVPVSMPSESVSKDENKTALADKHCTQLDVHSINDNEENTLKTLEVSSSGSSVVLSDEDENTKMESKSVSECSSDISLSVHGVNEHAKEIINSTLRLVSEDVNVIPLLNVSEKPMDMCDVNDQMKEQFKPVSVGQPTHDGIDVAERIHSEQTKEKIQPISEYKDDIPWIAARHELSMPDEKNETPHGVCNMNHNAKDVDELMPDIRDGTFVLGCDKPLCGVDDRTPANVQDVNDTVEEARPEFDGSVYTSVIEHHGNKEGMPLSNTNVMENVLEKYEENAGKVTRSHSSDKTEAEQLIYKNTNCEMDLEELRHVEESNVSALEKDCLDLDKKIGDEKNPEDEAQGKVNEGEASCGKTVADQISCPTDIPKPCQGDIKTGTGTSSGGEHINDDALVEMATVSSTNHVSSTAHLSIKLKEGYSSLAVKGHFPKTENNNENTELSKSPVTLNETPVIYHTEPKKPCIDVPPCTVAINPEPEDRNEDCPLDSTKAIDLSISNSSVAQTALDKDLQLKETDSNQTCIAATVYTIPPDKMSVTRCSFDSQDMTPPALQIDTECELNSRSCTPTQDELPYGHEGFDDLQDNHSFECELHSVSRSPTIACLSPDSPPTNSERHISNSPDYRAQSLSHDTTDNVTVENNSKSFISEPVPKQKWLNYDHKVPPTRHPKELQPQKSQFGNLPEQYKNQSSGLLLPLMDGSTQQTDEPDVLRESYAFDENPEGPLTRFKNSTSIHREVAQIPACTEYNPEMLDSEQQFHYSVSMSTEDASDEWSLPFRHQADLHFSDDSLHYSSKKICQEKWTQENSETDHSIKKTFFCGADQTKTLRTVTSSPYSKEESKQSFDWRRYFRRDGVFPMHGEKERFAHVPPSSIITVFDNKGNRVVFENSSALKPSVGKHGVSKTVKDSYRDWEDQRSKSEITQSLMENEYLIFSEKMNRMLKNYKTKDRGKSQHRPKVIPETPMTIQFSRLDEQESSVRFDEAWPTLSKFKINVDISERKRTRETMSCGKPLHLQRLFCERGKEATCSKISDITKECTKSYTTMMNDICFGKTIPHIQDRFKRKWEETAAGSKQSAFCGRIKKAMFDNLHDHLNTVVRQACFIKYNFYILVTSDDPFFEETKDLLVQEGHAAVEPFQFDMDNNDQTPLLIIIKNEDFAEHFCEVPHLLDLKKSSRVLFAGIDRPDDVVNLTHQELFAKGGFVVFDETALDTLTLENMKKIVGILEELDKKGKWKWFLHYRNSRKLRENARCSPEALAKKNFMICCQEAGIVEVLPYHECDVISRDRPDYLRCLVHLQVQNASARFPVFITDTPAESFGKNGILTMNIYTFSRILSNDTCSVS